MYIASKVNVLHFVWHYNTFVWARLSVRMDKSLHRTRFNMHGSQDRRGSCGHTCSDDLYLQK